MTRLTKKFVQKFDRHHDELSVRRQRTIARLALTINAVLLVVYFITTLTSHWHVRSGPLGLWLGASLWILSILSFSIAASVHGAVLAAIRNLGSRWQPQNSLERPFTAKLRKYVFYPGAYANFSAIAVLVEESGGLVRSPFTPVLFAVILTAQQLSRFKTNSRNFISFGILITGMMFLLEWINGVKRVPEPPSRLAFLILALSFLLTAFSAHTDRPPNYRAKGNFPDATHVELYREDRGTWRYVFHCNLARLDPMVETVASIISLAAAKNYVHQRVQSEHSFGTHVDIRWEDAASGHESVGMIVSRAD